MKKFIIEQPFWDLFPNAKIAIIVANGVNNHYPENNGEFKKILRLAQQEGEKFLTEAEFAKNKVVSVWREAFQKFKTKKGARCSIEAMLKRIGGDNPVGNINPLVDIYNSISLRYALPCGGENIDAFDGDVKLTLADGGEYFVTYGSGESAPPYPGEVVYKDNSGAICRCWNWRESERTMLTDDTTNAFLIIENVDTEREDVLKEAINELKDLSEKMLGGTYEIHILDINNKEVVVEK